MDIAAMTQQQQAQLDQVEVQIARARQLESEAAVVEAQDLATVDLVALIQARAITREITQIRIVLNARAIELRRVLAARATAEAQRSAAEDQRTQRLAAIDAELADLEKTIDARLEAGTFVSEQRDRQWQLQKERAYLID